MKGSTKFFYGILLGAAAGALAGVLFAPEKGSATRQKLGKKVREYSDEYGLELDDLMDKMGVGTETERVTKTKSPGKKVVSKTTKTPSGTTIKRKKVVKKPSET